ncbi:MAG: long-chain fatty acid--CoA ligase [Myxococcales bacterium]|nr:long-chain fatty acid--CoA ligase [Myxococcales bacterium]
METTQTLVHQIAHWATHEPDRTALRGSDGATFTWAQYWQAIRRTAKGFIALGLEPGQCVAIIGNNRPEWVITQFGIMAAGGIPAPIYATNTTEQVAYIVRHSKSKIVTCDGAAQLARYNSAAEQGLIDIDHKVVWDDVTDTAATDDNTQTLDALMTSGDAIADADLDARIDALDPDIAALLIYTSGTTGVPKGAELSHRGMTFIGGLVARDFPVMAQELQFASAVSYLPLCHVAEQMVTNFWVIAAGGTVTFCEDIKTIKDALTKTRPHMFLAVPRVWEKFQAIMETRFAATGGIKGMLLAWARATELKAALAEAKTGVKIDSFTRRLADKLVLSKIRGALGLDRLVVAISGAAPISAHTLEFFASIGIVIYEGFGMTETSGVATAQPEGLPRFGTIGKAITGVEMRIADDGEIQLKGPCMTLGYRDMPEKTAELFTDDGWLRTGDLGSVDDEGYLRITGRKKDILITAGGKNVAPAEMENLLKSIPGVGNAVVCGDRQPYLTALMDLDPEALPEVARAAGVSDDSMSNLVTAPEVMTWLQDEVESRCNPHVARYQTIKKFRLVPEPFSVEGGELTPTMKVRRAQVNEKHGALIAGMYG